MALTDEQAYEAEYNKAFYGDELEASQADDMTDEIKEESVDEEGNAGDNDITDTDNVIDDSTNDDVPTTEPDDVETEQEPQEESEDHQETDEPKKHTYKLKIDGKEVEMDFSDDDIVNSIQKSFDYTRKTQALAEYKKTIEKMNSLGIETRDLEVLARAKAGDREALAFLTKSNSIDPIDLIDVNPNITLQNEVPNYVPSQQVQEILDSVTQDRELTAKLQDAEKSIPKSVMDKASQDPNVLYAVINEVRTGDFEQVQPHVELALMRMSDYDRAYIMNSSEAYVNLYNSVKNDLVGRLAPQTEARPAPVSKPKPNMAEVGIKKSGASSKAPVLEDMDAFNDDATYQKMLAQLGGFNRK